MRNWMRGSEKPRRDRRLAAGIVGGVAVAAALMLAATGASAGATKLTTKDLWGRVKGLPAPARTGAQPQLRLARYQSLRLDRSGLAATLKSAPAERTKAARTSPLVVSLPSPTGAFQSFALQRSSVMAPGLALRHPEIATYSGRGITDPAATIRADLTPLGFHASVRSPHGGWYIDPYYRRDQSVYVSYYGRDARNVHGTFVERGGTAAEISAEHAYYHAGDTVQLNGYEFDAGATVTVTITDPEGAAASRELEVQADGDGAFQLAYTASPDGSLGTREVEAAAGADSAATAYDVVSDEDSSDDPPVGDQLRTYRLALLTDPGYANYFGAANVTSAKVTLINRVSQVYEDETSIHLELIANNDALNLNTAAQMTGSNGPCGGTACYTAAQSTSCTSSTLTRTRQVIGLLVGASSFDVGHIALGQPGGGVASLGVVGGNNKAQGCTGLTTPVGDFFAVDYVAHEMGHQFAGNHTFNGTQSNCSGGNRNAATSVEPGSGSSIMAYAGICATDNLQPHSDPYWSQRSFDEITTYTSAAETNINEVQMGALTSFNTNGQSFQLRYNGNDSVAIVRGTNYTTAGVQAAIQGISGWPAGGTAAVSALSDTAFTVTFGGTLANTNVNELQLVNCTGGCTGYVGEIAKGGATTRRGTVTATGNNYPTVTVPAGYTIPLRTPFALTGSGSDSDGDTVTYLWEQNDRGAASGTGLVSNTKTNGPLFRQFGTAANVSASDTLLYHSPGENAVTTDPTRVFPDLAQILANNTNAETGTCPAGNVDCFSEFLPTSAYVGFTGVNASPLSLHFRLTVRDGHPGSGGVNTAQTTLLLATGAGPFLVTAPNTAVTWKGASTQTIAWNPANTQNAPVSTANVKISLSTDGGYTYPYVLAASTANDGSQDVQLPNVGTTQARVKIEAVGNVFFDLSNADFTIQAVPVATNSLGEGGSQNVQYSDSLSPDVTVTATDPDSLGKDLSASASGLPSGMSLSIVSTTDDSTLPGSRTWKVSGATTAAPGSYPVTVTVTDETGGTATTSFTIVVTQEDADATYTGDMLAFTASGGSTANVLLRATVRDSSLYTSDAEPGDVRNATVTFKEGATTLCGPLAVSLINGATTTGTASCTKTLGLDAHVIDIYVNNYYVGSSSTVVEVAQPNGSFITGGGYHVTTASAGTYKADAGTKASFGFNVKYTGAAKNPKGHVNIVYRAGGNTYQIKSTAIDSLGMALKTGGGASCAGPPSATCFGLADFRSKANLTNVTTGVQIPPGNMTLQVTVTDKGEPGSADTIGVTLWNGSTLVFSSEWSGAKTNEGLLEGGNLVVH
jgi:trimeric autotransporter adhesin